MSSRESTKTDPWAAVAQKKLLLDGTKEEILNVVARKPKTVAQMAKELGLSSPTILTHVRALMESELLRESEEMERRYPAERFYEPNFPIVSAEEHAQFETLCEDSLRVRAARGAQRTRETRRTSAGPRASERCSVELLGGGT